MSNTERRLQRIVPPHPPKKMTRSQSRFEGRTIGKGPKETSLEGDSINGLAQIQQECLRREN